MVAVPLFGYFHGAFVALFQLVVQDAFGIRSYGSIMGSINLSTIVPFGIGTILAGAPFDLTGVTPQCSSPWLSYSSSARCR